MRICRICFWIMALSGWMAASSVMAAGKDRGAVAVDDMAGEWISFQPVAGAFPLVTAEATASLCYDADEHAGVIRAIDDLREDMLKVTGRGPRVTVGAEGSLPVIIGSMDRSGLIADLVHQGKIRREGLEGKWESYVIAVVEHPWDGADQALVIAGSDKRGTVYGIYELSRRMGVSPWY